MIRDTIMLGTLGGANSAIDQDWNKPGQALGNTLLDAFGSGALGYAGGKAFEKLDDVIKAYADDWHSSEPTIPTGSMKWPNSEEELFANAGKNGYSGGTGKTGRNIIGTNYNQIKPTQDWINMYQVNAYAEKLLAGEKLPPIEVYEVPGKGMFILDGHHRFVASQITGIPVEIRIIPGTGPVGLPDWTSVLPE